MRAPANLLVLLALLTTIATLAAPLGALAETGPSECVEYGFDNMLVGYYEAGGESVRVVEALSDDMVMVFGADFGMQIVSLADMSRPVLVSTCDVGREAYAACRSGDYVFVADGTQGLRAVDVSDPLNPRCTDTFVPEWPATALAVRARGDLVMAAMGWTAYLLHVDGEGHLDLIAQVDLEGTAVDIAWEGNLVCVASGDGAVLLDLAAPDPPEVLQRIPTMEWEWTDYRSNTYCLSGCLIDDGKLYLFNEHKYSYYDSWRSYSVHDTYAQIFDITDPRNMTIPTDVAFNVLFQGQPVVDGERMYIATSELTTRIYTFPGFEFIRDIGYVREFPAQYRATRELDEVKRPPYWYTLGYGRYTVIGDHFIMASDWGFEVVKVARPMEATLTTVDASDLARAVDDDKHYFIYHYYYYDIYFSEIKDYLVCRDLSLGGSSATTFTLFSSDCAGLLVKSGLAYLSAKNQQYDWTVRILDLSAFPGELPTLAWLEGETPWTMPPVMKLFRRSLFVGVGDRMHWYKNDGQGIPILERAWSCGGDSVTTMAVTDGQLWVGTSGSLQLFSPPDVGEMNPRSVTPCERVISLELVGSVLYSIHAAAAPDPVMRTYLAAWNVTDPDNPILVSRVPLEVGNGLISRNDILYVEDLAAGLLVFGLADPLRPEIIGLHMDRWITPERYLRYTHSPCFFPTSSGILKATRSNSLLFPYDCREGTIVANFLSSFACAPTPRGVVVTWNIDGAAGSADDYRLIVSGGGGGVRSVPFTLDRDGVFRALDQNAPLGVELTYSLERREGGAWVQLAQRSLTLAPPKAAVLHAAAPNPFNPTTTLSFTLMRDGDATLAVYDAQGRRVRVLHQGPAAAGLNEFAWDGRDAAGQPAPSGVYFARLMTEDGLQTRKMALLK